MCLNTPRESMLEDLGVNHGLQGKELPEEKLNELSTGEIAAYDYGLYRGSRMVENNPLVDNRPLLLSR